MMWEYAWLDDDTQISYSDVRDDNTILVVFERPRDWGFDTAECLLPSFHWSNIEGFSDMDMSRLDAFVKNNAALISRLSYEGGRVYA